MVDYKILYSKEEIEDFANRLLNYTQFAFDLETTGLDTHSSTLETVGFGFALGPEKAFYIPVNSIETHGFTEANLYELFRDILENPHIGKIGQNIKYDARVCRRNGIKLNGIIFDTLLASYCLFSDRLGHGLDDQSLYHFGIVKTRTKTLIPKKKKKDLVAPTMKDSPIENVGNYCMEDVDFTYRLYEYLSKLMNQKDNEFAKKIFYSIELPLLPVLIDMECNGTNINLNFLDKFQKSITNRITRYQRYVSKVLGRDLEITKPDDVAKALYEELKLDEALNIEIPTTKTGKKTTAAKTLEKLSKANIVKAIQQIKICEKLMGTYITALPMTIGYDGFIHPSFNQAVTSTGRLSCQNPNLQQIPSRNKLGKIIRKIFNSRWKDGSILAADMSQAEFRILAHVSRDETMVNAFHQGIDIHDASLERVREFLSSAGINKKIERRDIKVLNFGMVYGMGPTKLSNELNIDIDLAKLIIKTYLEAMPGISKYLESSIDFLYRHGYVETLYGRRRYIPKIYAEEREKVSAAAREGGNMPIQGSNGDMIKLAMVNCSKEMRRQNLKSLLIMQVHDELVFDIYPGEEQIMKELVVKSMTMSSCLDVPMEIGADIGPDWATAHA